MVDKLRRILVIDDMESIHADFAKALSKSSDEPLDQLENDLFGDHNAPRDVPEFELEFASQGLDGIEKVRAALAEGRPFSLAFVDVRMPPGLDGVETIAQLWQVDPRLEVVICTAYSDYSWQQMLEKLSRSGQFLVLGKPFDGTVVKQMALGLTEKWHLARAAERTNAELEKLVEARTEQLSSSNRRLEQEIKERAELERKLRHAQKLEALGRLVAGVAHEINNPLGFVLANLAHLQGELEEMGQGIDEHIQELLQVAKETREGGKRIQQIVKDLKTFVATETREAEELDVTEVMAFALRMARASFPGTLLVESHFEEPRPRLCANSGQLSQVFLNLLVNAAQAMGSVPSDRQRLIVTVASRPDQTFEAIVEDTGTGIKPEDLPRIFDPFFTTKGIGAGTGLGLSICHGIVKALGGEILVDSTVGVGTRVTVKVPLERPASAPQAEVFH
ncbi:MAG: ATP-binding protein [Myxococcaceae bacterium]